MSNEIIAKVTSNIIIAKLEACDFSGTLKDQRKSDTKWADFAISVDKEGLSWKHFVSPNGSNKENSLVSKQQFTEIKEYAGRIFFTNAEAVLVATKPSELDDVMNLKRQNLAKQPNSIVSAISRRLKDIQEPKKDAVTRTKREIAQGHVERIVNACTGGDLDELSNVAKIEKLAKQLQTALAEG